MHDFYITKFFQQLIFGKSGNGSIFLVVLVFLLNLGAVMAVDGYVIHNIPAVEGGHEETYAIGTRDDGPDFSPYIDGEILDTYGVIHAYDILYRAENGEKKLVSLNCNEIFHRYRINRGSEITIPEEDPYEYDSGPGMTRLRLRIENDQIMNLSRQGGWQINRSYLLFFYIFIALLFLGIESYILQKVTGRE